MEAKVYVPKTCGNDVLSHVERTFSDRHGGCTTYEAYGSWVNETDELVRESVWVVTCLSGDKYKLAMSTARAVAAVYGRTDESAVMGACGGHALTYDGEWSRDFESWIDTVAKD